MFFSIFCSFLSFFHYKMSLTHFLTNKKTELCHFGSQNAFGKEFVLLLMSLRSLKSLTTLKLLKLLKLQYHYEQNR